MWGPGIIYSVNVRKLENLGPIGKFQRLKLDLIMELTLIGNRNDENVELKRFFKKISKLLKKPQVM